MIDPNEPLNRDLERQREMQQAREDEERLKRQILAMKEKQDKIIYDKIRNEERERCAKIADAVALLANSIEKPIAQEIARQIRRKDADDPGTSRKT